MARKWSIAVASLLVLATVTACGNSNNSKDASSASPGASPSASTSASPSASGGAGEPVKLTIAWWGSQARHDATQKALEQYTALHPNVTFESTFSGWDGYFDKLAVQYSAGSAPDIIQMDAAYVNDYVSRGLLADIGSINTADVDPSLMESGKVNGVLYAQPLGVAAIGMVYDKTVVDKLGLKAPDFNWTWDDYYAFGQEAKAKLGNDKYVYADQSADLVDYTAYQYSMGKGYIYDAEGNLAIDKATWIEYQTKQKELRDAGILTPPDLTTTDKELDPQLDNVVNGNAIVRHLFSNQVGAIDALKPGTYEYASLPKGSEAGGWLKPSMFWSVNAQSKHQEEAKAFIDWFINDLEAGKTLGLTRGTPVSGEIVAALSPEYSEGDKKGVEFMNQVAPDAQKFVNDPVGYGNFKNDYKLIVEKIQFGSSTPEQAYEELLKKAGEYAAAAAAAKK
ncbi:ABC transporter substrate-binding protein [Cohnella sp. CIP 111063]|uniref:ABC transporter substrate-binding protein n=1 Tax=unclassified Cohnella TaxID=2636738 RepID=UPI000B8C6DB5|nr:MULTISPECIES: extracellular solute-binding protein [unclassified Cohnella]OXS54433.1 ABC transporter substrate-binding protein [Cohnella sp. CIP 111063]PRX63929.1 ABC-type glycerol-3-phosphate transport system substrate-binding protein [Cohnella sp. SGD-V74]